MQPPSYSSLSSAGIVDTIHSISADWGLSGWAMERLSYCESTHDPYAYNSAGPYHGLYQFDWTTWAGSPYGEYSIYNVWAQVNATAWYITRGEARRWPYCGRVAGFH